jgi:hypothetical protein
MIDSFNFHRSMRLISKNQIHFKIEQKYFKRHQNLCHLLE